MQPSRRRRPGMNKAVDSQRELGVPPVKKQTMRERRARLADRGLVRLVRKRRVVGVTTNPTIFARAIESGDLYDPQIGDPALGEVGVAEALRALTTTCAGLTTSSGRCTRRPTGGGTCL